jgi:hypothetical protein
MKLPSLKAVVLTPIIAFTLFYAVAAIFLTTRDRLHLEPAPKPPAQLEVAIFGASGTAGDGILKAALASSDIGKIHIVTRRVTPRIQAGIDAGKVEMLIHQDYLDYASIIDRLAYVDAVYWAIGISSLGVDEKTYGMIHVDFPMQFVQEWNRVTNKSDASFHYISSSDISVDSSAMWAREKIRAENSLFGFADNSKFRVIAYRPDYIGPTDEQATFGQNILYWFFKPVGAAVKATEIGQAMIDVTLRSKSMLNGSKLSTRKIVLHADSLGK